MKTSRRTLAALVAVFVLAPLATQAGDQAIPFHHRDAVRRHDVQRHPTFFFGGQPRQNKSDAPYENINTAQTGQGMGVTYFVGYSQPASNAVYYSAK